MSKANRNKAIRREAAKQVEMRPDAFEDKRIHVATKLQTVHRVENEGEESEKHTYSTEPVKLHKVISGKREAKRMAKLMLELEK